MVLFFNSLFTPVVHQNWHSRIVRLSRIQQGRSTAFQGLAPSILLLPVALPKLLSVCQKIAENCQPLMVTSYYLQNDVFICFNPFEVSEMVKDTVPCD